MADRAIRSAAGRICPVCDKPYSELDIISINGSADQVVKLREQLQLRKSSKGRKRKERGSSEHGIADDEGPSNSNRRKNVKTGSTSSQNLRAGG